MADVLRRKFRDSDTIARLGGDEFVILAADALAGEIDNISARLHEQA